MMRPMLTLAALALIAGCNETTQTAGPERSAAAGQVLGGDTSDAMLPLDTAQSTSPPDPRPAASTPSFDQEPPMNQGETTTPQGAQETLEQRRARLPRPQMSNGPEPLPDNPGAPDGPPPPT